MTSTDLKINISKFFLSVNPNRLADSIAVTRTSFLSLNYVRNENLPCDLSLPSSFIHQYTELLLGKANNYAGASAHIIFCV